MIDFVGGGFAAEGEADGFGGADAVEPEREDELMAAIGARLAELRAEVG